MQSDITFQLTDSLAISPANVGANPYADSSQTIEKESIATDTAVNHVTLTRFITSSHKPISAIEPKIITQNTSALLLVILIVCLFVLGLIRFTGKKALSNIFQAIQTLKPAMQYQKYSEGQPAIFNIFLFFITVSVFSVFVVILNQKFNFYAFDGERLFFEQFSIIPSIIGGLLIMQMLFARLSGFLFNSGELAKKYIANSFAVNVVIAIVLLPILMISLYDSSLISTYVAIIIAALLFIFRTIKSMFITLDERKYFLYHFFIYFCTLEILPVLIIIKAVLVVDML